MFKHCVTRQLKSFARSTYTKSIFMDASGHFHNLPIVRRLSFVSLIAALVSVPLLVFQASEHSTFEKIGETGSYLIWLYFVAELIILLRIWDDNFIFVKSHLLEVVVVIVSSPILALAYDAESLFGVAPFLRVVRFVKLAKLGKIGKAGKLLRGQDLHPAVVFTIWMVLGVVALGIIGTIADHEAHSFADGLEYWISTIRYGFHLEWWNISACLVALVAGAVLVRNAHRQKHSKAL